MPSLDALLSSPVEVIAVVTNPDRPSGRGLRHQASPVKRRAQKAGLEVLQPTRATDAAFAERLRALSPDVATVVAYGRILPKGLLDIPPLGFVNVHFSLLPELRGAAPVQRALMDGMESTGVSIIVLTEGMDEGPLLAQRSVEVLPDDNAGTLGVRLAEVGARLLPPALESYAAGAVVPREQEHDRATYAPKISPAETRLDWNLPAGRLVNVVRALDPDPGAWTTFRGGRLRVVEAAAAASGPLAPGELRQDREPLVGTGEGALVLRRVQPAAKRAMTGAEWARGARLSPGDRLE